MTTLLVNLIIKVINICFVAGSSGVGSFMTYRAITERERKTFFSTTHQKVQKQKIVKVCYVFKQKIVKVSYFFNIVSIIIKYSAHI